MCERVGSVYKFLYDRGKTTQKTDRQKAGKQETDKLKTDTEHVGLVKLYRNFVYCHVPCSQRNAISVPLNSAYP